ncbi:MAG: hypothetical protein ACT4OO_01725 [Nitrospiraceae bacterium]
MRCSRCHNLMVEETFADMKSGAVSFKGWRCLICGDIVDPLIGQHRASRPQPTHTRAHSKKIVLAIR